jgi:hypothetical protein
MDSLWLAHLDAHIATGQVATEAESAETLTWLLKLEPEQRWCLIMRRDPRLECLLPNDYRRLLTLMVELEPAAMARAAAPPQPCLEESSESPPEWRERSRPGRQISLKDTALEGTLRHPSVAYPQTAPNHAMTVEQSSRSGLQALAWLAVPMVLGAGGFGIWQFSLDAEHRLASLTQETLSLGENVESKLRNLQDIDRRVTQEVRESERQRQSALAFLSLGALSRKVRTGQPFSAELAALQAVWPESASLASLKPYAKKGIPEPAALLEELGRLNEALNARYRELVERGAPGWSGMGNPYARFQTAIERKQTEALQQTAANTLALARQGDWQGARDTLRWVDDPGYRSWRERVSKSLATYEQVSDLLQRFWSQWATAIAAPSSPQSIQPP